MGEGHTYSNYSVTAARPPTLKYWLQISGRTAETNIRIIRQKYTVFRHRCVEVSGNGSDVVISPVKTCNIFNLRVLLTERIEFWVKSWLTWNLIKTSSERPTSKAEQRLSAGTLSSALSLFVIRRRWWKYWKLSQEWVIIAAWVQAGPRSQNNSVGQKVLWKQTWTLSGTGDVYLSHRLKLYCSGLPEPARLRISYIHHG